MSALHKGWSGLSVRRAALLLLPVALAAVLVSAPPVTAQAPSAVPVPAATLTEVDVPGTSPMSATAVDLAAAGYTAREFYAEGLANRYTGAVAEHVHDRRRSRWRPPVPHASDGALPGAGHGHLPASRCAGRRFRRPPGRIPRSASPPRRCRTACRARRQRRRPEAVPGERCRTPRGTSGGGAVRPGGCPWARSAHRAGRTYRRQTGRRGRRCRSRGRRQCPRPGRRCPGQRTGG